MRRHTPILSQYSRLTRETLVFDKLNYRPAPRLGGTVKSHGDYIQETVLGPGNHLRRDISIAKVDSVASKLFCRTCAHISLLTNDLNPRLLENVAHLNGEVIEELIQAIPCQITVLKLIIVQIFFPGGSLHKSAEHPLPIFH